MTVSYEYHRSRGCLIVKPPVRISLAAALSYFEAVIHDREIDRPFFEVVDFTYTEELEFGYMQSRRIFSKIKQLKSHNIYLGLMLIATSDYTRGMANIYRVVGESSGIRVDIVATLDEALALVDQYFAERSSLIR